MASDLPANERVFLPADQQRFAALSGDFNPLHVDPILARRLLFGEPVVHGVHALLWCLETVLGRVAGRVSLAELKAQFRRPLLLGRPVRVATIKITDDRFLAETSGEHCRVEGRLTPRCPEVAAIPGIVEAAAGAAPECCGLAPDAPAAACRDRSWDDVAEAAGRHPLWLDHEALRAMFPHVAGKLPPPATAAILATTRLTGMECPGLHTIFDSLALQFGDEAAACESLPAADPSRGAIDYRVELADARFSLLRLAVRGEGIRGKLTTFFRPAPAAQPSLQEVARRVRPGEFAEQRALVIGGSRGLGEVAAKILAAGGASVRLTYHVGRADAERVAAEILEAGADCRFFPLDVTGRTAGDAACKPTGDPRGGASGEAPARTADDARRALDSLLDGVRDALGRGLGGWQPTHVYYFATPRIAPSPRRGGFSQEWFERYRRFYVEGLQAVLLACGLARGAPLCVFVPSAVSAEAQGDSPGGDPAEYAAAKRAAEAFCEGLARECPACRFAVARLPRLRTDQAAALVPRPSAEPLEVLLGVLRPLGAAASADSGNAARRGDA